MFDLNQQLERWLDEEIITADQAQLMRRSAMDSPSTPIDSADEERRIPIVTEILGYVGAALAVWAVIFLVSEYWGNLTDWAQMALFGALALSLLAAGGVLLDSQEPAIGRLSGILWAGSVLALGGALFVLFDPILDYGVNTSWTLIGGLTAVAGGLMLGRRPEAAQHIVFFAAAMTTLMSMLNLGADPELFVFGFVAWGIGLVWVMVSRSGLLQPAPVGMILGAITMLYGAQLAAIEGETDTLGILLGLASAALFAGAGVLFREKLAIILGGIGIFWFVPQAMFHFFGETFGGMFGLFFSGLAIVALAVWFSRHKEAL